MTNYEREKKLLLMINDRPEIVTELLTKNYGYTLSQLQLRRNNNISLNGRSLRSPLMSLTKKKGVTLL